MPPLANARHERFAQELAKGKTATEALELAGYADPRNSTRLTKNDEIRARVTELQMRAAAKTVTTAADIARQLDEDREFARECKQAGAAVSASLGKAKVLGIVVDKIEHTGKDGGPIETADVSARELVDRRISGLAARTSAQGDTRKPH